MKVKETFKRSFFKTFTWRVFASLDTALLTWFFSVGAYEEGRSDPVDGNCVLRIYLLIQLLAYYY